MRNKKDKRKNGKNKQQEYLNENYWIMANPKAYSLALEVDMTLKLELSNGQFERFVSFIDGYEDFQKISTSLKCATQGDVLAILQGLKEKK